MIGNLTIDKASMNISYFLYTIKVINDRNGRIERKDFGKQMGDFIGVSSVKNGKENRTPYNKSKLPRYFGFVDMEKGSEGLSYLTLTHRGKVLTDYISDNGKDAEAAQRYCIDSCHREDFIDLIFESVIFDSFGKNNCGAEQSNTDVEPPKIVFKSLLDLGRATAEEICFIMFGLNRGELSSYKDGINKVRENRRAGIHDYSKLMDAWGITNIVHDCKIINLFTDDNIKLLTSERNDEDGKFYYYLSKSLDETHKKQIASISATYEPLKLFAYSNANYETVNQWVEDTVLGRVSGNDYVFKINSPMTNQSSLCWQKSSGNEFKPGMLEKAILKAFQNEKKNIYLIVENTTENHLISMLGDYYSLLERVDDFRNDKHGWSKNAIVCKPLFDYLVLYSPSAKQRLKPNEVLLPSNIHIVGTVFMENNKENLKFDYQFKRCLVQSDSTQEIANQDKNFFIDESTRLAGGSNVLLYGVPGSGKSWTIEHEYCKKESNVERLVFHPDYTYSDFIGQILPNVAEDGQVSYKFTKGPFTNILDEAYHHPKQEYILIIEEINRGNAPAIFGEVFQLLDRKTEIQDANDDGFPIGTSEYGISNANISKIVYNDAKQKVRIPSNLSIIGTMNTSDQNVFTLDTAFQRRWNMRLIENNFDEVDPKLADAEILDTTVTWRDFCTEINNIVVGNSAGITSSEDKRLGAYFVHNHDLLFNDKMGDLKSGEYDALRKKESAGIINEQEKARLTEIRNAMKQNRKFPEKVIKYLWDDAFKFNREVVFETTQYQSLEQVIRVFMYAKGRSRFDIFKENVKSAFTNSVQ